MWVGSLLWLHLRDHCRSLCWSRYGQGQLLPGLQQWRGCWVNGVGSLMCGSAQAGHSTPDLDTHKEEGALGAGSCRDLPSSLETELKKLGGSSSAYQAAKSDTTACQEGCQLAAHAGRSLGATLPARVMQSGTPESSQTVEPRTSWGGITHLPFL